MSSAPVDVVQQRSGRRAAVVLAALSVKGRAPMTGYSRELFGPDWTDDNDAPLGHNGCDTRNDILRRDLRAKTVEPGTGRCVVLTGVLRDPYTATRISFHRGESTSMAVQIDHVVAMGDAWRSGAQRWAINTRTDLANDPLNLLAVDGPTNGSKSDGNAATWLPPNKAYRCSYIARQIAVKARYKLWVTQAERDAMSRVLASCPQQRIPAEPERPVLTPNPANPTRDAQPHFENCAAAQAAGAAPLHPGDPGYSTDLDRDRDGVACET